MRALLIAAAAFLVVPAAASAKELTSATICGASGCKTIAHPSQELGGGGDGLAEPAPKPGPYYTVELTVAADGNHSWTIFYIPGSDLVAFQDERGLTDFEQLYGSAAPAWREAIRGVRPFAEPTVTSATVAGQRVSEPQSYLSLFTQPTSGDAYPAAADFVPIVLHAKRPSPWTDARYLMFSPSTGALERGTSVVQLPPATVDAIVAGESLAGPTAGGGSDFAWPLVTGTLAAVLALGLATLLLVRRSRHPATV